MECSVCYSVGATSPSCGHPVCGGCAGEMLKHDLTACPLCRKTMDLPGVKEHDLYLKGCRESDPERAAEIFTTAAELGHPTAMFNIGVVHAIGHGLPQDLKKAMGWWRKASRLGVAQAMYNRGVIFSMKGDPVKARRWFLKGARNGCERSEYEIGKIFQGEKKYARAARWMHRASLGGMGAPKRPSPPRTATRLACPRTTSARSTGTARPRPSGS